MRYLALLLIFTLAHAGEAKPLPLDTQAELAKSEKAMNSLKADYLKKANQEVDRLTSALQDQMKRMTQAGDLEGALIIRDKIAEVSKGEMIAVTSQVVDLFGKPNIEKMIVGKWKDNINNGTYVFNIDRTCEVVGASKGKWQNDGNKIYFKWEKFGEDNAPFYDEKSDTIKWEHRSNRNDNRVLTRLKP